jgi:hypothetical protein
MCYNLLLHNLFLKYKKEKTLIFREFSFFVEAKSKRVTLPPFPLAAPPIPPRLTPPPPLGGNLF